MTAGPPSSYSPKRGATPTAGTPERKTTSSASLAHRSERVRQRAAHEFHCAQKLLVDVDPWVHARTTVVAVGLRHVRVAMAVPDGPAAVVRGDLAGFGFAAKPVVDAYLERVPLDGSKQPSPPPTWRLVSSASGDG